MDEILIILLVGCITSLLGVLLLKKEKGLMHNSSTTSAKVITYYPYQNQENDERRITMYTMAVEYTLPDGTLIHAREQSGSNRKKYPIGTALTILYNKEKPDFFIVEGDKSRIFAFIGMILVGIAMVLFSAYMLIS